MEKTGSDTAHRVGELTGGDMVHEGKGEKAGRHATGRAKWTFMVYMAGDNNLDGAALRDIEEMARAGSTKDVNILVQLDRIEDNLNGEIRQARPRQHRRRLRDLHPRPGGAHHRADGFRGRIVWDEKKPDGQTRWMLDTTRTFRGFVFRARKELREGLEKTIDWYVNSLAKH